MGNQSSKDEIPLQQTDRDLRWSLNENVKWSDRASSARHLLDGRPLDAGFATNLPAATSRVLREVDAILAEGAGSTAIQPVKAGLASSLLGGGGGGVGGGATSTSTGGVTSGSGLPSGMHANAAHSTATAGAHDRYGCGSNKDIFDMEKAVSLPLSHPAHQFQASQFFGVAATKEILLLHNASLPSFTSSAGAPAASDQASQLQALTRDSFDRLAADMERSSGQLGAGAAEAILAHQQAPLEWEGGAASTSVSSAETSLEGGGLADRRLSIDSVNTQLTDYMGLGAGFAAAPPGLSRPGSMDTVGDAEQLGLASNPHEALGGPEPMHAFGGSARGLGGVGLGGGDAYVPASNYDTLAGRGEASTFPAGAGTFGLPSSAGGLGVPQAQVIQPPVNTEAASKERIELATKYLFISGLLQKMISSAQLSYQLSLQCEALRKRLKPKRTRGLAPAQLESMRTQYTSKLRILRDARELFLKSRLTLQWFYRDFDLNYAMHLLHDAEAWVRAARESMVPTQPIQSDYASFGSGARGYGQNQGLHQYEHTLRELETRRTACELKLQANERYALSIAHYYLSRHSPGLGLTPSDAPELDAGLFAMLDLSHQHVITREHLHVGMIRLAEQVDSLNARIHALRGHVEAMTDPSAGGGLVDGGQSTNVVASNATKIARLEAELAETRRALQAIQSFFLHTFTRNIFVNLPAEAHTASGAPLRAETIDARGLQADLRALPGQVAKALNPLDLANEGVVGPDEIVRRENVATGAPAEHMAGPVQQAAVEEETKEQLEQAAGGVDVDGDGIPDQAADIGVTRGGSTFVPASSSSSSMDTLGVAGMSEQDLQRETGLLTPPSNAAAILASLPSSLLAKTQQPLPPAPIPTSLSAAIDAVDLSASQPHLHPSELQLQQESLEHSAPADVRESLLGGAGLAGADTPLPLEAIPLADLVVATAAHAPAMASQLTPIAEVVTPSPFGGQHDRDFRADYAVPSALASLPEDVSTTGGGSGVRSLSVDSPRNAALAGLVRAADLHRAEQVLVSPTRLVHTASGSVHQPRSRVVLKPGALDLKQAAKRLKRVSWKKAQRTQSGGMHALTKANTRIIPESVLAGAPDAARNLALARQIQPAQLIAEKKVLHGVKEGKDVKPSSFGGRHDVHSQLGPGYIDSLDLRREHETLKHVGIERAPQTLAGGIHTINKKIDTRVVPEKVLDSESPANVPLAGVITQQELKAEKRRLDHVPIEHQRETMSGGVHMNDTSAALHPTLFDRVKELVGLHPVDTTAPELGHVVPGPGEGKRKHSISAAATSVSSAASSVLSAVAGVVPGRRSASPLPAAGSSTAAPAASAKSTTRAPVLTSLPIPQNASLADRIHTPDLRAEASALVPALPAHQSLAKIIGESQLIMGRRVLHHVDIARIELKNDLAAGVGSVTTRKATPRRRSVLQQASSEQAIGAVPQNVTYARDAEPLQPGFVESIDSFESQKPIDVTVLPSTNLPHVIGRGRGSASATTSASSSRATSPVSAGAFHQVQVSEQWAKTTVGVKGEDAQTFPPKERGEFDAQAAREQNVTIDLARPPRETMLP